MPKAKTPKPSASLPAAEATPDTGPGNPKPAPQADEAISIDNIEQRLSSLLQAGDKPAAALPETEPQAGEPEAGDTEPAPEEALTDPEAEETPTETSGEDEDESEDEGEDDLGHAPDWYQKRIKKFSAKEHELKSELETLQTELDELKGNPPAGAPAPAAGANPLANLRTETDLAAKASEAEGLLDLVDDLLIALPRSPDSVARRLREQKIDLRDDENNEDFSPERMDEYLRTVRRNLDRTVRVHVPAQREHLRAAKRFDDSAAQNFPFVSDRKAPEHAVVQEVLNYFGAGIKSRPDWKVVVGVHTLGLIAWRARQAKAKAPKVAPKPAPRSAAATLLPGAADPKKVKFEAARAKLLQGDPHDYIKESLGKLPTFA